MDWKDKMFGELARQQSMMEDANRKQEDANRKQMVDLFNDVDKKLWEQPYRVGSTLRIRMPNDWQELKEQQMKLTDVESFTMMTREEAHSTIFDNVKSMEGKEVDDLLTALEALGVIRFKKEEVKKEKTANQVMCEVKASVNIDILGDHYIDNDTADAIKQNLFRHGYSLVKESKFENNSEVQLVIQWSQYKYYGTIKVEEWPEGLVLWVGGTTKWKSWEQYLTPREIHDKYIQNAGDKCVTIFGMTSAEIAKALDKNKKYEEQELRNEDVLRFADNSFNLTKLDQLGYKVVKK